MKKTVLFDLDGTLTDPKTGITKSVAYALERFGIHTADLDTLECFIGPPLKQSFMEHFSFSEQDASSAVDYYREYFADNGLYENTVYPGIPELLSSLKAGCTVLGVATSKPTVYAEKILAHFNLSGYFRFTAGSNLNNTRTDKKDVIAYAMAHLGCAPRDTIMVGDRKHDIIGAKANGLESVGVLYGYAADGELEAAGADYIAGTPAGLGSILKTRTAD